MSQIARLCNLMCVFQTTCANSRTSDATPPPKIPLNRNAAPRGFQLTAMQHIYTDPTFQMAADQFDLIAERLEVSRDLRDRLKFPKRSLSVSVPVRMDDGSTQVFQGYRVQHTLAMGPTKGGTRFGPSVTMGEMAALAMWMSWKCALAGLPYGGAKGATAGVPRKQPPPYPNTSAPLST